MVTASCHSSPQPKISWESRAAVRLLEYALGQFYACGGGSCIIATSVWNSWWGYYLMKPLWRRLKWNKCSDLKTDIFFDLKILLPEMYPSQILTHVHNGTEMFTDALSAMSKHVTSAWIRTWWNKLWNDHDVQHKAVIKKNRSLTCKDVSGRLLREPSKFQDNI